MRFFGYFTHEEAPHTPQPTAPTSQSSSSGESGEEAHTQAPNGEVDQKPASVNYKKDALTSAVGGNLQNMQKEKRLLAQLKLRRKDTKQVKKIPFVSYILQLREADLTRCYDCKVPFGMLSRTFVCQLCNGTFDKKCAESTVNGALLGKQSPVRVCNWCSRLLSRPAFQGYDLVNQLLQGFVSRFPVH